MREFLFGLAELGLTMGAVIALLLALGPAVSRKFRPQWRYWAWLLVALRLAVPFNVSRGACGAAWGCPGGGGGGITGSERLPDRRSARRSGGALRQHGGRGTARPRT